MANISINNGRSYCSPTEAVSAVAWDEIVSYMDADTREAAHANVAPCSNVEYLTEYLRIASADLIIG